LASITPGIESNPGKENAGIKTPSPLLTNDWFSIGRVERSSRIGGKLDPEHFGIERNVGGVIVCARATVAIAVSLALTKGGHFP
jgi:hypothetical protein